jgi:uncharacterized protein
MVASGQARFYPSVLMLKFVRGCIRVYQILISPVLSWMTGPGWGCRFEPTCSTYFAEAVEIHGFLLGSWLGVKRIGRCHPWGGYGRDPVPIPGVAGRPKEVVCE